MKYIEKLKSLETVIDGWDYAEEVLAGFDVVLKEVEFIKNNPNLEDTYVIAKLQKSKEMIQNSINLLKRRK